MSQKPLLLSVPVLIAGLLLSGCGSSGNGGDGDGDADGLRYSYDAANQELTVYGGEAPTLSVSFGRCGAIREIVDLRNEPEHNLIAPSYQGESTDRVLQWTYWNSAYLGEAHDEGDGDRRVNVTMEGAYGDRELCDPLSVPEEGTEGGLTFRSEVSTWFYSTLNAAHGRPRFETTVKYTPVKIEREVTRRPWMLYGVYALDPDGELTYPLNDQNYTLLQQPTWLVSENLGRGSVTSYLETWAPFHSAYLPEMILGESNLSIGENGYRFFDPEELGGWAAVAGTKTAVGIAFGNGGGEPGSCLNVLYRPDQNVSALLPCLEADWPDDYRIRQVFYLAVDTPENIENTLSAYVENIPAPVVLDTP